MMASLVNSVRVNFMNIPMLQQHLIRVYVKPQHTYIKMSVYQHVRINIINIRVQMIQENAKVSSQFKKKKKKFFFLLIFLNNFKNN